MTLNPSPPQCGAPHARDFVFKNERQLRQHPGERAVEEPDVAVADSRGAEVYDHLSRTVSSRSISCGGTLATVSCHARIGFPLRVDVGEGVGHRFVHTHRGSGNT